MNKKLITVAAFLAATTLSFGIETWYGDEGIYQIVTDLDDGDEESGYWFTYADDSDGGASSVTLPKPLGNDYSDDALDQVIDYCGGVCGTFKLDKGSLDYNPFVGIGFNVAGPSSVNDASEWGGVCIAYSSDFAPTLELGLGDEGDKALAYDNPAYSLSKSAAGTVENIAWDDFEQAGWGIKNGGNAMTGPEAAAALGSIKFKIQAKDGSSGAFNIMSFGAKDGGCRTTEPCGDDCGSSSDNDDENAIGVIANKAMVKLHVSNRSVAFQGIKSVASAEVMNLQGQVVAKASVSAGSAMNLSSLQAGVYMVRVSGKSVDFSQKIILK